MQGRAVASPPDSAVLCHLVDVPGCVSQLCLSEGGFPLAPSGAEIWQLCALGSHSQKTNSLFPCSAVQLQRRSVRPDGLTRAADAWRLQLHCMLPGRPWQCLICTGAERYSRRLSLSKLLCAQLGRLQRTAHCCLCQAEHGPSPGHEGGPPGGRLPERDDAGLRGCHGPLWRVGLAGCKGTRVTKRQRCTPARACLRRPACPGWGCPGHISCVLPVRGCTKP